MWSPRHGLRLCIEHILGAVFVNKNVDLKQNIYMSTELGTQVRATAQKATNTVKRTVKKVATAAAPRPVHSAKPKRKSTMDNVHGCIANCVDDFCLHLKDILR